MKNNNISFQGLDFSAIKNVFIVLLVFAIFIKVSQNTPGGLLSSAECNDQNSEFFVDTDTWQIADTTVRARILWQKAESFSHVTPHLGPASTGIVASDQGVLYWQTRSCESAPIVVAVNSLNGQEEWRRQFRSITNQLYEVEDGYILENIESIIKFDHQGQLLWKQNSRQTIPYRSIREMFALDDALHFLTDDEGIYTLSNETGDLVQTENDEYMTHSIWGDYHLVVAPHSTLDLVLANDAEAVQHTFRFPRSVLENRQLNLTYPSTARYLDVLYFFFETKLAQAYDITTGQLLWSIDEGFYGIPAIIGDYFVVYTLDHVLEIRDPITGNMMARIGVNRVDEPETASPYSIWIAGYDTKVFIRHLDTHELVAIEFG